MSRWHSSPNPGPILAGLIEAGHVVLEDWTYVGTASDGARVQIASVGYETSAEIYLTDYPTPESW